MLRRWLLYVGSVSSACASSAAARGVRPGAPLSDASLARKSYRLPPQDTLARGSAEGDILGEFGEERRAIVAIRDVPDVMINAILAAEDERFYSHGGSTI
jgi:penicillin-binding protein 1A